MMFDEEEDGGEEEVLGGGFLEGRGVPGRRGVSWKGGNEMYEEYGVEESSWVWVVFWRGFMVTSWDGRMALECVISV